jgi:signal peptidase I
MNSDKAQPATPEATTAPKSEAKEVVSFLKTLVVLIIAAVLLRECVIEAFKIPSGSMIPTLMRGDHILVSKLSYGIRIPFVKETGIQYAEPKRGDIVVFTRPDELGTLEDESKVNIIKRVVGLPGDKIEISGMTTFINGKPLAETSYAQWQDGGRAGGFQPEKTIPAGRVFLMGDNRDHSKDSRFWEDPFLPINRIKGRALFIYFSWHDIKRVGTIIR